MSDNLTPKQDSFISVYLETGNATEAYRRSYDTTKMKDPTINRAAKELLDNPKIATRLQVLKERAAAKVVLTRSWVLEQLMDNAKQAKLAADFTASNKALELLGKTDEVGSMFVDRSSATTDNRHTIEPGSLSPLHEFAASAVAAGVKAPAKGTLPN
jgi:phage terminase small subunit